MRRASFVPIIPSEPLIVVEESPSAEAEEEEDAEGAVGGVAEGSFGRGDSRDDDDGDSTPPCETDQLLNPYLLCPWRDTRKGSLPTPACTSGITASQVRRLSERGPESGPSPREQAFLATLSAAPAPQPGGRRHSVVTISRAPPTSVIFGRNRRESIAVLGAGLRRDSATSSSHNLALDIMDDIADMKAARKTRVIGPGGTSPGASTCNRRYSDVSACAAPSAAASLPRRRSEQPATWQVNEGIVCSNSDLMTIITSVASSTQDINKVEEENEEELRAAEQLGEEQGAGRPAQRPSSVSEMKKQRLQGFRSNSFDVGMLVGKLSQVAGRGEKRTSSAKSVSTRKAPSAVMVTLQKDKPTVSLVAPPEEPPVAPVSEPIIAAIAPAAAAVASSAKQPQPQPQQPQQHQQQQQQQQPALPSPPHPHQPRKGSTPAGADGGEERSKVVWDGRSGSLVDAHLLGSAIEGFLNKDAPAVPSPDKQRSRVERAASTGSKAAASISSWFSSLSSTWTSPGAGAGAASSPSSSSTTVTTAGVPATPQPATSSPAPDRADTPSDTCNTLCSTLKDLFVK